MSVANITKLCLLYLISFLDRTNIGNAKIEGLQQDLKMSNNQYNNTLTIFFISYSLTEPLTQVLLKKFRPSIFLPVTMILWGICEQIHLSAMVLYSSYCRYDNDGPSPRLRRTFDSSILPVRPIVLQSIDDNVLT